MRASDAGACLPTECGFLGAGAAAMIGASVADLELGDRLPTLAYRLTPFAVAAYCRAVESDAPVIIDGGRRRSVMPPPMLHVLKVRLLEVACPAPVSGRRMHAEFDAQCWDAVEVGADLTVDGEVVDLKTRGDNTFIVLAIEVRETSSGRIVASVRDTTVVSAFIG